MNNMGQQGRNSVEEAIKPQYCSSQKIKTLIHCYNSIICDVLFLRTDTELQAICMTSFGINVALYGCSTFPSILLPVKKEWKIWKKYETMKSGDHFTLSQTGNGKK